MAIAHRLSRYVEFVRLFARHGHEAMLGDGDPEAASPGDATSGEALARDLETLGPTFVKLGQVLSSRADLIQPQYLAALERLQDAVEPFPYDDAVRIVGEELGVRPSKVFADFDPTPIAAASLGQVHRAMLRDGRAVAVKVQRPGVRERIIADLDALSDVATVLERLGRTVRHLDVPALLEEFRLTLLAELDYRQEARNLVTLAHQLRDFDRLLVPLPIDDFTSARVLTMDYLEGTKITRVGGVEWTEVDGRALADDLFRAYLHQVLVDGFFHADPHPGNVLLTPDHRLALIDLGMVGRLSARLQEQLFRLVLAIADSRADEAAAVVIGLGERLDDFDEPGLEHMVVDLIARHATMTARDFQVGRVMLELSRRGTRHGLRLPSELALLGKTLLNLDEIGRLLDRDFDVHGSIRRNATGLMRQRMLRSATSGRAFSSALDLRELAERLPARINRILESLAGNDLRLKVEMIDQGAIIEGLQKVANRIATGLVLAALIVGAAMLMRVPTAFTILGYPGIAMLLFLAAAAGGAWMVWTIVAGDVRRPRVR
jgi:predicted unusual protein kinase regulating ubiquinone biosynthesis (AarF/ABC1/UbiB family)